MDRTAYFVGEWVPIGLEGLPGQVRLEVVGADSRVVLYQGPAGPLWLDTSKLAPGDYRVEVNRQVLLPRLTLTSTLRRSAGSIQDEATPREPQFEARKKYTPEERAAIAAKQADSVVKTLEESGTSACLALASVDMPRQKYLDTLARAGAILLANPDTRPTSFCPTRNAPEELDSMSQRLILAAQANGRHPNFGGFCYGWDTCGFAVGARRMLLVYWGWGPLEQPLRRYIDRIDAQMTGIFTQRTGLSPVTEAEYLSYLLSIGRPEFATMIDLPTKTWLEAIARHVKPMAPQERAEFERRLDAWSAYLMSQYNEVYGTFSRNLREVCPSMQHTASIQVDHTQVRNGQYFPLGYAPLDFQYQSTWNDQVGGPDYAYQWLYTQALLAMSRGDRPTWISNAIAAAHGRAAYPGKFTRTAAHGLAFGASGIGFALEGFSNLLGGMAAKQTGWDVIRDASGGADVRAGRDFLDRFAALAISARGDHGVGILFSKSQFQRQHVAMGFGQPNYKVLVALTRLGYTPRFITEEDLVGRQFGRLKALVILGQTFPLMAEAARAIASFAESGGLVLADASTTVELAGARRFQADLRLAQLGKPHNWGVPNMPAGDNDTLQYARWHAANAPILAEALGETGRGVFRSEQGPGAMASLLQIDGGRDATYVVAVNDSYVATQADWHKVRERLVPTSHAPAGATVYDLSQEQALGRLGPIDCDLSATTACVFGVLARPLDSIELRAAQKLKTGDNLVVAVRLKGTDSLPIQAVVPLCVSLVKPDGRTYQEFYRATEQDGLLALSVPVPANAQAGQWSVLVRCQLDGTTARLPIVVEQAPAQAYASAIIEPAVVRGRAVIEGLLQRGQKLVLPIFDSPQAETLLPVAEKVKSILSGRGVEVEIRRSAEISTYWLTYDPTDEQKAENARADRGETFGQIKRATTNANDWFAALSGWRFGRPVILLDLADVKDNPMAESLVVQAGSKREVGLLWPLASRGFPGPGRAVLYGLHWAFAPRVNALVIQAADVEGLLAGAAALASLPEDRLTASVEAARAKLWQERAIGGRPARPALANLTSNGLQTGRSPQPFAIAFPRATPPTAEQAQAGRPRPPVREAVAIPATFEPRQLVPFVRDGDQSLSQDPGRRPSEPAVSDSPGIGSKWVEASAVAFLVPDLRFSHALQLIADVKQPGKVTIVVTGQFRYCDRQPMTAAQWEDVQVLYNKLVPKERKPMEIEVLLNVSQNCREPRVPKVFGQGSEIGTLEGRTVGLLRPSKTESREVPLEAKPSHGAKEVRKALEEVVVELHGEVELPAGRQEILLAHHNLVDGKIERIDVGMRPAAKRPSENPGQ